MNDGQILSVSEITGQIKTLLEDSFADITVIGELSNFKAHYSGHWYFTLKDSDSAISCAMWRGFNSRVAFTPQDGMKLIVKGHINVYPPRGSYQIDVRSMQAAGEGELQIAFEKLKRKLLEEGLFDEEHKKPLPEFPERIGIATSIDGAARRDMENVAARRFPLTELVIAPCKVQGAGAADSIAAAIKQLNRYKDIDLIIAVRGGGSLEDLWAFNEEAVARAIYNSRIPVISGVGHETDFTIADFTADLRAPTPSAAMELATPDKFDFYNRINNFTDYAYDRLSDIMNDYRNLIETFLTARGFNLPYDLVKTYSQKLDHEIYRLNSTIENIINDRNSRLKYLDAVVRSNDIKKSLKKGFVFVKQEDKFVTRAADFKKSMPAELNFYDSKIEIKN